MNASLILKENGIVRHLVILPAGEVSFGRDKNNDVKLAILPLEELVFQWATADISRKHFIIRKNAGAYFIRDCASTNGTSLDCIALLNREKLLQNNQVIDVGGVLDLMVELRGENLLLQRLTNTPEESYLLFSEKITLGSSAENLVRLSREKILPNHAYIHWKENNYYLTGCKDASISLNSETLAPNTPRLLRKEEKITLGDVEVLFKIQEAGN